MELKMPETFKKLNTQIDTNNTTSVPDQKVSELARILIPDVDEKIKELNELHNFKNE